MAKGYKENGFFIGDQIFSKDGAVKASESVGIGITKAGVEATENNTPVPACTKPNETPPWWTEQPPTATKTQVPPTETVVPTSTVIPTGESPSWFPTQSQSGESPSWFPTQSQSGESPSWFPTQSQSGNFPSNEVPNVKVEATPQFDKPSNIEIDGGADVLTALGWITVAFIGLGAMAYLKIRNRINKNNGGQ